MNNLGFRFALNCVTLCAHVLKTFFTKHIKYEFHIHIYTRKCTCFSIQSCIPQILVLIPSSILVFSYNSRFLFLVKLRRTLISINFNIFRRRKLSWYAPPGIKLHHYFPNLLVSIKKAEFRNISYPGGISLRIKIRVFYASFHSDLLYGLGASMSKLRMVILSHLLENDLTPLDGRCLKSVSIIIITMIYECY